MTEACNLSGDSPRGLAGSGLLQARTSPAGSRSALCHTCAHIANQAQLSAVGKLLIFSADRAAALTCHGINAPYTPSSSTTFFPVLTARSAAVGVQHM